MDYNGNVKRTVEHDDFCYDNKLEVWEYTKDNNRICSDEVRGIVWATDEVHAVKIANEFRTMAIAENRMHIRE